MYASGTLMKSPGKTKVSGYRRAPTWHGDSKFEWSYLLCMECDEHFLLFYPPSHVLKRSAASPRFAMHSSYEEVVSGVESPFGLLKPYLHDSMIARSIQTLS